MQADPANPGKQMLVVYGTKCADDIRVRAGKHGAVEVLLKGKSLGSFTGVSRVVVYGQDGNDQIRAGDSPVPVVLFGGSGNDRLSGSRFNDILIGGDGNDDLYGSNGNDVIVGGAGKDNLHSVLGNDLLVGGGLTFQNDVAAMTSILGEWTRTDRSFAARVSDLQHGGGFNGANKIDATSLVADSARDTLHGTPGADWLVSGTEDKVDVLKAPAVKAKKGK